MLGRAGVTSLHHEKLIITVALAAGQSPVTDADRPGVAPPSGNQGYLVTVQKKADDIVKVHRSLLGFFSTFTKKRKYGNGFVYTRYLIKDKQKKYKR